MEFTDVRANKLPKYWRELCEALGCPQVMEEPLVMQLTNQQNFEDLLTYVTEFWKINHFLCILC